VVDLVSLWVRERFRRRAPAMGIGSNDSLCKEKLPQPSRTVLNTTMTNQPTQSRIILVTNTIKKVRSLNGDRHQYRYTISSSQDHTTSPVNLRYTQRHQYITKLEVLAHLSLNKFAPPKTYLLELPFELQTDRANDVFYSRAMQAGIISPNRLCKGYMCVLQTKYTKTTGLEADDEIRGWQRGRRSGGTID